MQLYWKDRSGSLKTKYFNSHTEGLGAVKLHLVARPQMGTFCWDFVQLSAASPHTNASSSVRRRWRTPALWGLRMPHVYVGTHTFYCFTDYGDCM